MTRWTSSDVARLVERGRAAQLAVDKIVGQTVTSLQLSRMLPPLVLRAEMNRLESAYAQLLELERMAGSWQWWAFEPITLRLAQGARYTPDFGLLDPGGHLVFHETKGHFREAAKVRIKVAAELYPFFRFVAVTRPKGGTWTYTQY